MWTKWARAKRVVSVKIGKLKADDVRSLMAVREREAAEFGFLIALDEPTPGMIADATTAGYYTSGTGKKSPRLQLLTIGGLMNGTQRAEHPDYAPANFKKAAKESVGTQKGLL